MENAMRIWTAAFFGITVGAARCAAMDLTSSDVADGGPFRIDQLYRQCSGGNISPALNWSGVPPQTKTLAVTIFDEDANPSGWWHWIVMNMPPNVASIARGGPMPAGSVIGENDFGDAGYGGPCPPPGSGQHHYDITVWALDDAYPPNGNLTGLKIGTWLQDHAIDKARITGTYER
jgi:Raf kinase inhibitor-like YbhB/YbcL family protein